MGSQGYFEVHRREYSVASGAEMNRTHLVFYRNSAGSNFSFHAPHAPGCVPRGETLEPMRPAREAHLEMMADQGDSIPEAHTSPAGFNRKDFAGLESSLASSLAEQSAIQVPAYGRIHQAIPA
jgi:predicted RNase H-like HicB family nuclease